MKPDERKIAINEHQRWMGYLQPEGLVVSPLALVDSQVQLDTGGYAINQDRFLDALKANPESGNVEIDSFALFGRQFLGWKDELLDVYALSAEVPDALRISTGEHGEILEPDAVYRFFEPADATKPFLLLIKEVAKGGDFDQQPDPKKEKGWVASAHQKFERLLRESGVPIGILCSGNAIRLVYAPKGENSGWLTFPVGFMTETAGRVLPSALDLLLSHRRLITVPEAVRLPSLLQKSRDYQAHVSTDLSHQVLEALFELCRGFRAADEKVKGKLLEYVWERDPQEIYGGLITTLLRMVFLLYAEDRSLMPNGSLYLNGYSLQGLYDQLRKDQEQYPDTMEDRFGGWPRLLALFRAIHGGCKHRSMTLPAREGHLFDPSRYPFLEGRLNKAEEIGGSLPRLSDGALYRVLHLLLHLNGERLSYRTLDVEQIGSVYETIMGFHVEKAPGRMIALKPKKKHGAPIHISLDQMLSLDAAKRSKLLQDIADTKLPAAQAKALKEAKTTDEILASIDKRIDRRATPHVVPQGSILLQPTDERRRSGSHYTPRSFTEPIVRKTLEPILYRLGRHPRSEIILDLKVADIAVGSAAFLVETCRQLADELVSSWHYHKSLPVIPPDEDEMLYARRLVAQRCLYGVDCNPMAVDLAKLSLWLATMAQDHPFTFLDHAIKCGDSLVGLTNEQVRAFHWELSKAQDRLIGQDEMEKFVKSVIDKRRAIISETEDTVYANLRKKERLEEAEDVAQRIRDIGDLAIAAFFAGSSSKERQQHRNEFIERHLALQRSQNLEENIQWQIRTLHELRSGEHPIRPFHWEIEFPEVFSRENPGFDGIVGNPPFIGGKKISGALGKVFSNWLGELNKNSSGNADIVAHFFLRAFKLLRKNGAFSLIATNTIAQGDTRRTGLRWIGLNGGEIFFALQRISWPGEAAVIVSVISVFRGSFSHSRTLNGKAVDNITAFLVHSGGHDDPFTLKSNELLSYIGCDIKGQGFLFDDEDANATPVSEMHQILDSEPRSGDVIRPYMSGEEINQDPRHIYSRWVIDFNERSESEARSYQSLFQIVESKVLPERATKAKELREWPFWQFWRTRQDLRNAIAELDEAIVLSRVGNHIAFTLLTTSVIVSEAVVLIASSSYSLFAVVKSRAHEVWVRLLASSLKDDIRYTPTDCFETFPFPSDWKDSPALEEAGKTYYEYRAELMVQHDEGLTKTYNRFHDPDERSSDILRLRELHSAMDRVTLDAYGWADIPTDCQFLLDYEDDEEETTGKKRKKKKPWRYRWPDEVRDEVLARLLALNAERHAEEVRLGIAPGMKMAKKSKKKVVQRSKRADELI